jgi:nucleoid-associated protein YgaU
MQISHQARRYGYKIKQRFRQDPFSAIVLYAVLLSLLFLLFAFRGLITTIFMKPLGIINPSANQTQTTETPETPAESPLVNTQPEETFSLQSSGTYTIKDGDTLSSVAGDLNLDWKKIAELNSLQPPYALKVGQEIKLPARE